MEALTDGTATKLPRAKKEPLEERLQLMNSERTRRESVNYRIQN